MNKKTIVISIIVFLLSTVIVVIGKHPYSIYAKMIGINDYKNNPKEVYRVYLEGKSLGLIDSKSKLEKYIDSKQEELKNKYNVKKVYAPSDLKIVKEITYDEEIKNIEDIVQNHQLF